MRHLKSSFKDIRQIFENGVTVKNIAEPLASFDADHPTYKVLQFMGKKRYDVIGVKQDGVVCGYAEKSDISSNKLGNHCKPFQLKDLLSETDPLRGAFKNLADSRQLFVLRLGKVCGIVTRADLQKVPVRLWLFGLVSSLEMQFLRIIKERYPGNSWEILISSERLNNTKQVFADRQQRNEEIDLVDCTQFCDKHDIILKTEELRHLLGFESKRKLKELLGYLENLRNELVHGQFITHAKGYSNFVSLIEKTEQMLTACENIDSIQK